MESLSFGLRPAPPFRLDLTAWALRRRARNIVDRWDGTAYRRVLVIDGMPLEVSVTQIGSCFAALGESTYFPEMMLGPATTWRYGLAAMGRWTMRV